MKIRKWSAAAALAVAVAQLSACSLASQEPPPTRDVVVQTPDAPGAECTVTSPAIGSRTVITPASVNVTGQDILNVSCRKECFQEGSAIVPPDAREASVLMPPIAKCKVKKKKK